ncbi:MAG: hypothetical protein MUC95_04035 [Spirochaetes bacterium]|nr:hypothetical protein [Spirochaetota bacterium]
MDRKIPSAEEIGTACARCGYVHIHQPLMTLLTAKSVWHNLNRIPYLDKSAWISIDMRDMGKYIKGNNPDEFILLSKALLKLTGAVGLMMPFPYLKHKQRHYMHMNISQKKTIEFISEIKDRSILPISLWGLPGLLETEFAKPENFNIADAGEALVSEESVNQLKKFLDSGGSATLKLNHGGESISVRPLLAPLPGGISFDLGLHFPLHYSTGKISLDSDRSKYAWKLLAERQPGWRLSVSAADSAKISACHAQEITSWMLDSADHPTPINDIFKNFKIDFYEYARLTRHEPAQALGINDIGHLAAGARASISIYDFNPDSSSGEIKNSLSGCWLLIKDGTAVIKDNKFTGETPPAGPVISDIDIDVEHLVKSDLLQRSTLRWENLAVNPK